MLLVVALGLFAFAQLSRVGRVNLKDIVINSGIAKSGYRNIALFGVDSREGDLDSGTNSDTIMVCSITISPAKSSSYPSIVIPIWMSMTDITPKRTPVYAGRWSRSVPSIC